MFYLYTILTPVRSYVKIRHYKLNVKLEFLPVCWIICVDVMLSNSMSYFIARTAQKVH